MFSLLFWLPHTDKTNHDLCLKNTAIATTPVAVRTRDWTSLNEPSGLRVTTKALAPPRPRLVAKAVTERRHRAFGVTSAGKTGDHD